MGMWTGLGWPRIETSNRFDTPCIILLWDHRRVCGPSLTETSLCGAKLVFES